MRQMRHQKRAAAEHGTGEGAIKSLPGAGADNGGEPYADFSINQKGNNPLPRQPAAACIAGRRSEARTRITENRKKHIPRPYSARIGADTETGERHLFQLHGLYVTVTPTPRSGEKAAIIPNISQQTGGECARSAAAHGEKGAKKSGYHRQRQPLKTENTLGAALTALLIISRSRAQFKTAEARQEDFLWTENRHGKRYGSGSDARTT